jgi:hypothetical protein
MDWTQTQAVVKSTLNDLGRATAKPLGERLLFRDRCFVGISFDFEDVSAIWLTAIQQLKFVDAAGGLLKVVSLGDDESRDELAARASNQSASEQTAVAKTSSGGGKESVRKAA